MATGDVLLFLHADGGLGENACQLIRRSVDLAVPDWGGFLQRIESDRLVYRWLEWGNAARVRWQGLVYGDQGLWVSRPAWEAVGGFQEIPVMEDFELSRRLTKIRWPRLLKGPVFVNPRRWHQRGVVRQTLRNWLIALQYRLGRSPEALARYYRRHGKS